MVAKKKKKTKTELLLEKHKADYEVAYEQSLDDATGQLHNRFVAYIAESRAPIYNVLVVLDILRAEVVEQIRKRQGLI
jgi:hypothetical protein